MRFLCLRAQASGGPISSNSGRNGGKNAGRNYVSALPQRAAPVHYRTFFPRVIGIFITVVVPPTVPPQLSAAAARCYGKLFCSTVLCVSKHITPRARRAHLPIAVLRTTMGAI